MKKLLISVLAIGVVVALMPTTASAVTCTIDQRPAATLLVPYFRAAFNADGTPVVGTNSYDTLVTITNNSSAAMLAHVVVWNKWSVPVLDFDIALTAYDSQSFSMQQILIGNLPQTPKDQDGVSIISGYTGSRGACQDSSTSPLPGDGSGGKQEAGNEYVRFVAANPAGGTGDNQFTTTKYGNPAWSAGSAFAKALLDELDDDLSACAGSDTGDGVVTGTVQGYVTIDHVNYCTLSFPNQSTYYSADAIGQENNLTGEVLYTSGAGLPTNGASTVNLEASDEFSYNAGAGAPVPPVRTFYARYWETPVTWDGSSLTGTTTTTDTSGPGNLVTGELTDQTSCYGDCREPLGLRTESRYFIASGISTYNYVWRGSSGDELGPVKKTPLVDLTGPSSTCKETENALSTTLVDEDEGQTSSGVTPSPPPPGTISNFPYETGRYQIPGDASLSVPSGSIAGVAYYSFFQKLPAGWADQAWVEYEFDGAGAFVSARIPGNQMDNGFDAASPFNGHSNCVPVNFRYDNGTSNVDLRCCLQYSDQPVGPFPYISNQAIGLP
jgi:hypothetical protein